MTLPLLLLFYHEDDDFCSPSISTAQSDPSDFLLVGVSVAFARACTAASMRVSICATPSALRSSCSATTPLVAVAVAVAVAAVAMAGSVSSGVPSSAAFKSDWKPSHALHSLRTRAACHDVRARSTDADLKVLEYGKSCSARLASRAATVRTTHAAYKYEYTTRATFGNTRALLSKHKRSICWNIRDESA
eukprot:1678995-Pleurochrysis_carterae.AAC.1